jgi:aldose sugar dehydrogenase
MLIFSSIKSYILLLILMPIMILSIQHITHHQTLNALIPKPGSLPLLNDTSSTLSDPRLKIEVFATGLKKPTNIAFLDSGDVLVLEKQNGTVRKIVNGNLLPEPLLDVNVATFDTRGMLGIAIAKNQTVGKEYVFLYFTEAKDDNADGEDKCYSFSRCIPQYLPNGNRLYRYELSQDGSKLVNQKLLFSWPPFIGATHNGGEITVGPDNNIYVIVGNGEQRNSLVMNSKKNLTIDGRAGILALDHDGKPAFSKGILGKEEPLNKYYAYGIRNGFGLDFDPVTGKLWDTENGPGFGDEINVVEPGFNSGSMVVQGMWTYTKDETEGRVVSGKPDNLVDFNGNGKYSAPELAWNQSIGPTAIKFLNSDKYGKEYENEVFVGSVKPKGDLYHFDLNPKRTGLDLQGQLEDKIADNYDELTNHIFGKNFGIISDITVGPDGYLYIVSFTNGNIYRIIPT